MPFSQQLSSYFLVGIVVFYSQFQSCRCRSCC